MFHNTLCPDILLTGVGQAVADVFGRNPATVGKLYVPDGENVAIEIRQPGNQLAVGVKFHNCLPYADAGSGPAVKAFCVVVGGHQVGHPNPEHRVFRLLFPTTAAAGRQDRQRHDT